jgi:hypothetical protein
MGNNLRAPETKYEKIAASWGDKGYNLRAPPQTKNEKIVDSWDLDLNAMTRRIKP